MFTHLNPTGRPTSSSGTRRFDCAGYRVFIDIGVEADDTSARRSIAYPFDERRGATEAEPSAPPSR